VSHDQSCYIEFDKCCWIDHVSIRFDKFNIFSFMIFKELKCSVYIMKIWILKSNSKKQSESNWIYLWSEIFQITTLGCIYYYVIFLFKKYNLLIEIKVLLGKMFSVWVVRKVRADFEEKLKRRRFKFLISFIKFKSFAARIFRTTQ